MFALDLFNTDHERRLAEGAVDQLEQRRIDDLAMKMDDLVARAKKADTPEARAALVKEFQKCKAERDSYYKIKDECMGYGTLTGEGQTTPTTTGLRHRGTKGYGADYSDSGVEFAKQKYHGDLNKVDKPLTKSLEKGMDVDFDEAGIPGNIPVEKIPGKEDLLKGRGRSYYEASQKKNSKTVVEYISMGSDKNYIEAEPYKNYKIYVRKKPFGNTGMYTAHTEIDRKEFMGKGSSQEEAIQAIRDRIDFVLNAQKKVTGSSTIDFNVKFATDLLADPKQAFYAKLENINGQPKLIIASPEVAGDPELLAAGDFKRSALRNQVDDEGRATPLPGIPLTAKSLRSGDWIANGRYTIGNETTDRDGNRVFDLTYHSTAHTKSDKLRLNQPAFTLGTTREVDEEGSPIASARRGGQRDNSAQARHTTYYGAMDEGRMGEIDAQRQDLEHMTDRQFMAAYGMSKQAFEHRYRTLLKPALDEARLAVGDPIVVTAPNEFEGKTGEIAEFSPSGSFVVVDLYNHGRHSMHLSDIAYNDYADQEEADDWYDDADEFGKPGSEFFPEGFQDFNKVEPYEVCLAGKCVKTFDYYEDARRFHDNWKKKLYREGDKAKADKITLNPILKELDANTLKSYAEKRGAQVAAMKADNPDAPPGSPEWIKRAVPSMAVARAKQKIARKERQQGVAEGSGEYKVYYMTAEDHKLMGRYASREEAEQRLNQLQSKYPDNKFIIWTNSKQGVAEDTGSWIVYDPETKQIKKRFKTHTAGKSYAQAHKLGFASSEYYFDRVKDNKEVAETTAFLTRGPRLSYGTQAQHTTLGPVQVEKNMPDGSVVVHCERDGKKYRTQPSSLKVAVAETVTDIKSEMAKVYRRLAPKIERHRDSFLAGQLYDELENIAELHGAEAEFKRMMAGARNRAHMDYDTNPGGFQNWFWYLPFGDNELAEESTTSSDAVERAILNRIMVANTDLLMKFGPDKVMQAAEEVAYNVSDVDEIGTSDVSAYVNQVRQILGVEA